MLYIMTNVVCVKEGFVRGGGAPKRAPPYEGTGVVCLWVKVFWFFFSKKNGLPVHVALDSRRDRAFCPHAQARGGPRVPQSGLR